MFPVLFTIAGFQIRSYGVLIAVGILAGVYLAEKEIKRKGLPQGAFVEFAPYAVIFGLICSRIAFAVTHMDYFADAPLRILNIRTGGLNFFGGLSGGFLAAVVYLKLKKIPFTPFIDCAAPALPAALFFGRIGCFLNGCCYGKPSSLPWAVTFTRQSSSAALNTPLHPSQLYEAGGNLIIFGLLWGLRKKNLRPGQTFYLFLLLYSSLRLFLERFRADTLAYITPGFAWTELLFIVIMAVSALMILNSNRRGARCRRKQKNSPEKQNRGQKSHSL